MINLTDEELKACYRWAAEGNGLANGTVPAIYIRLAADCACEVLKQFCLKNALSLEDDK